MARDLAVSVTGLGTVAGPFLGPDAVAVASSESVMAWSEICRSQTYHLPESARRAVLSTGVDLTPWVSMAAARRMSVPSKLGVAAALMALEDAGLSGSDLGPRAAVVMSASFAAVSVTERLLRTTVTEGPEAVSPFDFMESVANAPAAQIAIATGARGPNLTMTQREAGILTAVRRGAAEVASGRADIALVGGAEEMAPILHALLDRLGALARPGASGGEVARPFDRRRAGFVAAEGAVVLVLESEARALSRGARIRAKFRAAGGAFDPTSGRVGWGRGAVSLSSGLRRLFAKANVQAEDVGRIVSGASGSVSGDRLEARTLRAAWGDAMIPPVMAPKGTWGEYGGGFLSAAVLSVSTQAYPPTAGFSEPDPEFDLVPHLGGQLPETTLTLVTSLASGGPASWLLLEGP